MATYYVRSTDGDNLDDGSTWALAKATLAGVDSVDAAGDTVYVSQSHAESTAAAITYTFAGTTSNMLKVICGNDAAAPPTSVATGAAIATTGANAITVNGSVYVRGLTFNPGFGGTGSAALTLAGGTTEAVQTYENCTFNLVANAASSLIIGNSSSSGVRGEVTFKNSDVKLTNSASRIETYHGFTWRGGSILTGSVAMAHLIRNYAVGRGARVLIDGVDLSNMGTTTPITSPTLSGGLITLRNCKLPASWSGGPYAAGTIGTDSRVEMYNCDSGDTNYNLWIKDYLGEVVDETTITKSGGASDGVTGLSWKITSSSSAAFHNPFVSGEIVRAFPGSDAEISGWTPGASKTVTVEIVHDSATALNDDEVWLEVSYLGNNGTPLAAHANDAKANILASAAAQTTSSVTWTTTGLSSPNKQKLSVTITPQERGYLIARVYLAKASYTVYVDPKMTVA